MIHEGILSTIGNTPLIGLNRVFRESRFRLFAKLEGFNPGGSAKDRPALNILEEAIEAGVIRPETVIKAYGAELDVVSEFGLKDGELLQARINRVQTLLRTIRNSFWPNQYASLANAAAHYKTTMREIATSLNGNIDYLFCATSTCGTIRGCAEYVRDYNLKTKIFAVDAVGSVIFGGQKAKRLIPGHGAARRPELYLPGLADECIHVTDLDCVVGCHRLVRSEALLVGGSSGGVLMALNNCRHRIPHGATVVLIFHDRGERYLDTIYSESWVKEYFGDVSSLWHDEARDPKEEEECVMMTY